MTSSSSVLDRPLSSLDRETLRGLGGELTLRNTVGRDWTGVASHVGFTHKQVELLQQHDNSGKGMLLINTWDAIGGSSVRKLLYALLELKMKRVIDLLQADTNISEEDIKEVISEHRQLKQDGELKLPASIPDQIFYEVLYERPNQFTTFSTVKKTEDYPVERFVGQQCASSPEFSRELRSVYISYLSDSGIHKTTNALIGKLAEFIHHQRFRVHYKPFCEKEIQRMGGVNEWKEHCIQTSETIIVVCTPAYVREDSKCLSSQPSHSTKPSKLCVDSRLLRILAYTPSERKRLIPVTLDSKKSRSLTECIPIWMQSSQLHSWPSEKEALVYSLEEKPQYVIATPRPEDIIVVKSKVIGFPKHYKSLSTRK